jgi:serine protease AprX
VGGFKVVLTLAGKQLIMARKTKGIACLILVVFIVSTTFAQPEGHRCLIQFKDKAATTFSLHFPEAFLSSRSIMRRNRQGIVLNISDLPIPETYLREVLNVNGVGFITQSKWFNQVLISVKDTAVLEKMRSFEFIQTLVKIPVTEGKQQDNKTAKWSESYQVIDEYEKGFYGEGRNQLEMLNGQFLHERGFKGSGMLIGIIDAGFTGAKEMDVFTHLWNRNAIKGVYDFVDNDAEVYEKSNHGTYVLSTIAAMLPGRLIGTAPEADFLLLRSEDGTAEYLEEEYFWIAAAEYADSAGVDLLNTSLGYTTFDDPAQDHRYQDMDGKTTAITRGANFAASKGILVINSAGNSGNNGWRYVGAPADGDSVFAVGAVNEAAEYATFSSIGPTATGRTKPNAVAQGSGSALAGLNNDVILGSGTSFSGPILCGMAACLWQAAPFSSNMEVFNEIEKSADRYRQPNNEVGFGLPDFGLAFLSLQRNSSKNREKGEGVFAVFPNPFFSEIGIYANFCCEDVVEISLFDAYGNLVYKQDSELYQSIEQLIVLNKVSLLSAGVYVMRIKTTTSSYTKRIIKANLAN